MGVLHSLLSSQDKTVIRKAINLGTNLKSHVSGDNAVKYKIIILLSRF